MVVSNSEQKGFHPTAERVYRFIVDYKRSYGGDSPTLREIADAVGLEAVSAVKRHVDTLEAAGLLSRRLVGRARTIDVAGGRWVFEEEGSAAAINKCQ